MKKIINIINILLINFLLISGVSANDVKFDITEYDEINNLIYSEKGDDLYFIHNKQPKDELQSVFGYSDDKGEQQVIKNGKKIGKLERNSSVNKMIISENGDDFLLIMDKGMEMTIFKNLVPLGTYNWIDNVSFFNNDKSFIYTATKNNKTFIVIDNKELTKYDYINNFIVSGDNKHYAYVGRSAEKSFIVIDNKIVYETDNSIKYKSLKLSYDGSSYSFYELNNFILNGNIKTFINNDFDINEGYSPIYSKNGKNIYYLGNKVERTRGNTTITSILVKNGEEYKVKGNFKNNFQILNNGILWETHQAYETRLFLDEKELYNYFYINFLVYNEKTGKIAFVAKKSYKGEPFIVNDGEVLNLDGYRSVEKLTYSKNGDSLAFIARKGNEQGVYFMLNGKETSGKFDNIYNIVISDDGKRYAFLGGKNNKNYLVVDGVESEGYEQIEDMDYSYKNYINTSGSNKNISVVFRDNKKYFLVETAFNKEIKKSNPKLDKVLDKFFIKIDKSGNTKAKIAYNKILSKIVTLISKSKSDKTKETLEYIKYKIEEKIK